MIDGKVSFDLDGVLRNFARGFFRLGNQMLGSPVADMISYDNWDFEECVDLRLTKDHTDWEHGPIWTAIKASPTFWQDLDPCNVSIMSSINRIANKVFITNTVGVQAHEQCVRFLEKWGIENPYVVNVKRKGPAALAENVVAHLDDYIPNCLDIRKALGPDRLTSMLLTPYSARWRAEWESQGGHISLSVDHFIEECARRGFLREA